MKHWAPIKKCFTFNISDHTNNNNNNNNGTNILFSIKTLKCEFTYCLFKSYFWGDFQPNIQIWKYLTITEWVFFTRRIYDDSKNSSFISYLQVFLCKYSLLSSCVHLPIDTYWLTLLFVNHKIIRIDVFLLIFSSLELLLLGWLFSQM